MSHDWSAARHRFFVPPEAISNGQARLASSQAHQMRRVLRLSPGDSVILLDGLGDEYLATLASWEGDVACAILIERRANPSEPQLRIALWQAMLPRERLEYVLQKGTEAGVGRFEFVVSERTIARTHSRGESGQRDRWRRIVQEATEQCGRGLIPELGVPLPLSQALRQACAGGPTLFAWERAAGEPIRPALRAMIAGGLRELSIVVGPEGGFSESEAEAARSSGAHVVWMGPRVLRSETAGPMLAALALYESGDMGEQRY